MSHYAVRLRGFATQVAYVEAASKQEARAKAARGDFDDVAGYPDWERDENGWLHWAAQEPVEEIGCD